MMKYHSTTSSFALTNESIETLTNLISENVNRIVLKCMDSFAKNGVQIRTMHAPSVALVSHNGVIFGTVTITAEAQP